MRHFTLATGFALAAAVMFSMGSVQAATPGGGVDFGGPAQDGHGMCRQFNSQSNNGFFSYWDKCPGHEARKGGVGTRVIRVTRKHG